MEFIESFMKFSFSDDDIFRIEEDELVKDVENVKACECVVLISENVALIEAKSSSPRIENEEKFQKFISDIGQKFADSLQLFSDIKSKKKGDEAFLRLPANLQNTQIATEAYKIYLIINEATALENKLIVAYIPKAETRALRLPDGSVDDAKVQAWFAAHNSLRD